MLCVEMFCTCYFRHFYSINFFQIFNQSHRIINKHSVFWPVVPIIHQIIQVLLKSAFELLCKSEHAPARVLFPVPVSIYSLFIRMRINMFSLESQLSRSVTDIVS